MKGTIYPFGEPIDAPEDTFAWPDFRNGYIYVLQAGDISKVGKSVQPETRVRSQMRAFQKLGVKPQRAWISPQHRDWENNEIKLIDIARGSGKKTERGREFFAADFDQIVEQAQGLEYQPLTPSQQKRRQTAKWKAFRDHLIEYGGMGDEDYTREEWEPDRRYQKAVSVLIGSMTYQQAAVRLEGAEELEFLRIELLERIESRFRDMGQTIFQRETGHRRAA